MAASSQPGIRRSLDCLQVNVRLAACLLLLPWEIPAAEVDPSRVEAVREAMAKATAFMRSISTEGGYVYLYSPDLQKRTAERPARDTQIAIQGPGTPAMGLAFLRAYEATRDLSHLDAARAAARALARCRLGSGGWHATADFDPERPNEDGRLYGGENYKLGQIIKHTLGTSFDDDTTQGAVRFLVEFERVSTDEPADAEIHDALEGALTGMLRAQYPNGAWPQMYRGEPRAPENHPVEKARLPSDFPHSWPDADYTPYYTLNDNCQSDCVRTMLLVYRHTGRAECRDSARRGADFFLLAQLPEPHPAWAQQYNFAMEPAWGRSHEAPAVSSAESGNVIQALIDVYLDTGDAKYLEAAASAAEWLERSKIGPNRWSRLYELGTNRPIYGDERGRVVYRKEDLSAKYATSYVWESKFDLPAILARYERVQSEGSAADLIAAQSPPTTLSELEARVDQIIAAQEATGRWITLERWSKGAPPEPVISTKAFIHHFETLSEYLTRAAATP